MKGSRIVSSWLILDGCCERFLCRKESGLTGLDVLDPGFSIAYGAKSVKEERGCQKWYNNTTMYKAAITNQRNYRSIQIVFREGERGVLVIRALNGKNR